MNDAGCTLRRAISFANAYHHILGGVRIDPSRLLRDVDVVVDVDDHGAQLAPDVMDGAIYASLISAITGRAFNEKVCRQSTIEQNQALWFREKG